MVQDLKIKTFLQSNFQKNHSENEVCGRDKENQVVPLENAIQIENTKDCNHIKI